MKKSLIAGLSALALATSAASVALVGGSTASHAAGTPSSAYGLELTIGGEEVIPASTVAVESTDGSNVSDSLAEFPENPILTGGLIEVEAANNYAMARTARLELGDGLLANVPAEVRDQISSGCTDLESNATPLEDILNEVDNQLLLNLEAALDQLNDQTSPSGLDLSALASLDLQALTPNELSGLCDVLAGEQALLTSGTLEAECTDDSGTAIIEDLNALGLESEVNTTEPNQSAEIPGVLKVTVNEQTSNNDGTFTVNALRVTLLGQADLTVSSATCGEVTRDVAEQTDEAPAPTPVEANLAVTG